MKTLEMIEKLTKNPEKEFKRSRDNLILWMDVFGDLRWGSSHDYININDEWEEVKKPLTFMELLKSIRKNNKTISAENKTHGVRYYRFYLSDMLEDLINEFPSNVIAEILLDSEFYIED